MPSAPRVCESPAVHGGAGWNERRTDCAAAFASTSPYRERARYAGMAELGVCVVRESRGRGAGRLATRTPTEAAARTGYWTLVPRVFVEIAGNRALLRSTGFHEVGAYEEHATLDGAWTDIVIVRRLLPRRLGTEGHTKRVDGRVAPTHPGRRVP